MCRNSCHAYTGPLQTMMSVLFAQNHVMTHMSLLRVGDKKGTPAEYRTIPIGPFLQAQKASPQSSADLSYRKNCDWGNSQGVDWKWWRSCHLQGCFLGQWLSGCCWSWWYFYGWHVSYVFHWLCTALWEERSDCYIYIWLLLDRPPHQRYKKKYVLPGAIIPGPNHPKNLDSSFSLAFTTLQLSRMKEASWSGMHYSKWHFAVIHFCSLSLQIPQLLQILNGMVGHVENMDVRRHCGFTGRHKDNESRYYYAAQKPDNYTVAGCDHPDWSYFDNMLLPLLLMLKGKLVPYFLVYIF